MIGPNITTIEDLQNALADAIEAGWSPAMDVRIATFAQIAEPVGIAAPRDLMNGLPGLRGLFLPRWGEPGAEGTEPVILVIDPMPGS
jgi:hypothetical protein